ncbi:hypothetical protein OIE71_31235 [Streptomyces sp. NBC_01725]|uniref:hypothetical protein n=1 Tax=Streptomyces sp. NBC_01725 TaxID=2975923 RepID=UPI002E29E910|nr:hypothetical protein [Streptomyces sp. NBC_01725]
MRLRTTVAATALAALTLLGSASAATAGERGGEHDGTNIVNSEIVTTWIEDSFNTIIVFGNQF